MRVILTGGGTGGHIYPALAIGQAIQREWPDVELLYIGTSQGLENKIVPSTGIPFVTINVVGWQRKISLQALEAGWKAAKAVFKAREIINSFGPDLVIGTGGYVCLPVVWTAARKGIPTLIHEQNAKPGLTNRILSRYVDGLLLTFSSAAKYFSPAFKDKLYVTGLPIRSDILSVSKEEGLKYFGFSSADLTLVGVGGSRGARSINKAMVHVCSQLARQEREDEPRPRINFEKKRPRVQIIHITGPTGYEAFLKELAAAGIDMGNCGNIIIRPYLHQMEYALAAADLCIARAGATFIAEMTAKGIPGILVPYPLAAENHQEDNAQSLVDLGAAEMILDKDLTGQFLLEKVEEIFFNEDNRMRMAKNSFLAGKREAIEKIIQVIKRVLP